MPGVLNWGWDSTNKVWVPIKVTPAGSLYLVETVNELNDIGDVDVPSPTDGYVLYWDAATSLWKAKAHADLTTGVHGVGARHIAETSVEDLDLAAHSSRHEIGGADALSALFLADIVRASNFIMIPTATGWTEVTVGAGTVNQEPMRNILRITDANAGSALAHVAPFGFNIGDNYGRINWDKHLYIIFNYAIYWTEANLNRRIQIKEVNTIGQLAEMGFGFQVVDLVMTGEAYGTARGTVSLGNMVELASPVYKQIQVVIWLDPDTPAVRFYINGSLVDSITNTNHIPSGIGGPGLRLVHSLDRAAGGINGVASVFMQGKIWQEF